MKDAPTGESARAQLTSWAVSALPVIAGGIGFAGFVSLLGAGVLWIRFDAAELPADQALAKFPRGDLIATGAVTLALPGTWAARSATRVSAPEHGGRSSGQAEAR
jgi:hypothetical protein